MDSFNGRLRDELLNSWQFDALLEARVAIELWRVVFNHHTPYGDLTRSMFRRVRTINQPEAPEQLDK